jgi:hypothetical protein
MRTLPTPAQNGLPPAAMTFAEFLRWSRIGKTSAYREVKSGRLVLRKCGSKSLVLIEDAEAWLQALPAA